MAIKTRGGRRKKRGVRTQRLTFTGTRRLDKASLLCRIQKILTEEQQKVVIWYYFDGLLMKEIGALLGCGKMAVALRLKRIDARCRKAHLPLPRRWEHPYAVDHVYTYSPQAGD